MPPPTFVGLGVILDVMNNVGSERSCSKWSLESSLPCIEARKVLSQPLTQPSCAKQEACRNQRLRISPYGALQAFERKKRHFYCSSLFSYLQSVLFRLVLHFNELFRLIH